VTGVSGFPAVSPYRKIVPFDHWATTFAVAGSSPG
jgi:hypothetical protein